MMQQDSSDPTGVSVVEGTNTKSKELTHARERKAKSALALRMVTQGQTDWKKIAKVCGYPTPRAAKLAVERLLAKHVDTMDRDALRQLVARRLDTLLRGLWTKATDSDSPEHLSAAGKAREVIADYRRVYGIDAPQEILVSSPTQRDLDAFVAAVVSNSLPAVGNADIVDADVLADDDEFTAEEAG